MSRPAKGSTADELALKFLFANQDGVHVVLRCPRSLLVSDVKAQLMANWPAAIPPADNTRAIRLICMGRGMLQDTQTLEASKVPGFETHPTPVNVSVLRRPSVPSTAAAPAETTAKPQPGQQAVAAPPPAQTPGCGCCIQ